MVREPDGGTVIDLGVLPADESDEPAGPVVATGRVRLLAAVLAVAAVLTGVTAADPFPRQQVSTLAFLPSSTGSTWVVDDALVMVFENQRAVAYDPRGWHELWSVQEAAIVHAVAYEDLVVLFRGDAMNEPAEEKPEWALAVDRATGQRRWSSERQVEVRGDVLVAYEPAAVVPDIEVRDTRTGVVRWRVPAALSWTVDSRRSALWRIAPDRELVEHDLRTGAVRRAARVRLPEPNRYLNLTLGRDAVGLTGIGDGGWGRGTTLWYSATDLTAVSAAGQWAWEQDCGRGLRCAHTFDGEQVFLVDPASGGVLRTLPAGQTAGSPLGPLVLGQDGQTEFSVPTVSGVLDPQTGQLRTGLKGWRVLGVDDDLVRMLGYYDLPNRRTFLAELTERAAVRLGAVPYLLRECTLTGRTLICATMAGEIVVLRVDQEQR
ncbi:hypothetical protein ACFQO7_24900 [Catellatospora aurea]|uniref:Pyrroloquinoline-quinone binding quinoprotein n=1 Tax=Catellatospora aurea TaxID=1337874 RepID=A0ABW2H1H7_9ACTN